MRNTVATADAPQGAITTKEALEAHLSNGLPLWEGICGNIGLLTYGADFVIQPHRLVPTSLFLYADKLGAKQDVRCLGSLNDRHIGTEGYNDNWWFKDFESAEAYRLDRQASA